MKKQKGYKYKRSRLYDSLHAGEPDFRQTELAIRILHCIHFHHPYNTKLTQMGKRKDGSWTGTVYTAIHQCLIRTEPVAFKSSWEETWKTILAKDYLNIASQNEVVTPRPIVNGGELIFVVVDGEAYYIEILTKKKETSDHVFQSVQLQIL